MFIQMCLEKGQPGVFLPLPGLAIPFGALVIPSPYQLLVVYPGGSGRCDQSSSLLAQEVFQAAHDGPPLILPRFHITFRVAEPAAWARHLRLCSSANAVTGQGLGEESAANEAGNPVLAEVGIPPRQIQRTDDSLA